MSRILSIDYGEKRIGLALSDPLNIVATPLDTLVYEDDKIMLNQIAELVISRDVTCILVGYPYGLKRHKTIQTKKVDDFIARLRSAVSVEIIPWDERFTSSEAEDILRLKGLKPSKNKKLIDQMAARIILQEYLDYGMK